MTKPHISGQKCDPVKGGTLPGETANISEHKICCILLLLLPENQSLSTPFCHHTTSIVKNSRVVLLLLPALQTSVVCQQPGPVLPNIFSIIAPVEMNISTAYESEGEWDCEGLEGTNSWMLVPSSCLSILWIECISILVFTCSHARQSSWYILTQGTESELFVLPGKSFTFSVWKTPIHTSIPTSNAYLWGHTCFDFLGRASPFLLHGFVDISGMALIIFYCNYSFVPLFSLLYSELLEAFPEKFFFIISSMLVYSRPWKTVCWTNRWWMIKRVLPLIWWRIAYFSFLVKERYWYQVLLVIVFLIFNCTRLHYV